jgi:hypothetical protein
VPSETRTIFSTLFGKLRALRENLDTGLVPLADPDPEPDLDAEPHLDPVAHLDYFLDSLIPRYADLIFIIRKFIYKMSFLAHESGGPWVLID